LNVFFNASKRERKGGETLKAQIERKNTSKEKGNKERVTGKSNLRYKKEIPTGRQKKFRPTRHK